jgi:hypothetical protein
MMKPATKATPQRGMSMRTMGFSKGSGCFSSKPRADPRCPKSVGISWRHLHSELYSVPWSNPFATAMSYPMGACWLQSSLEDDHGHLGGTAQPERKPVPEP